METPEEAKLQQLGDSYEDSAIASTCSPTSPLVSKEPLSSSSSSPANSKETPGSSYCSGGIAASLASSFDIQRQALRKARWKAGKEAGGTSKYADQTFSDCERLRRCFRKIMLHKNGSVVGAWKQLDVNSDGKLSYFEFLRACQHFGVEKAAREFWYAMDLDRSGFVSLTEVDPELSDMLGTLSVIIRQTYGSINKAWSECFNLRNAARISALEFTHACEVLRFPGDAQAVFSELASDHASRGLSRQEFGFLNYWVAPGRPDVEPERKQSRRGKALEKSQAAELPTIARRRKQWQKEFKDLLLKSYLNFVRAWRQGLDRNHNNRLEYKEFMAAVKDVGFAGNPRELWHELDSNGNGWVSLWELDSTTAQLIQSFKEAAENSYGSWAVAWNEVMNLRQDDRVTLLDFKAGCKMMGYKGDFNKMFGLLDTDQAKYLSWKAVAWISGYDLEEEEAPKTELDANGVTLFNKYKTLTRQQRRRADINARNHRLLAKQFEGRARGEIPGSNPAAGTTMFSPGVTLNKSQSLPALTASRLQVDMTASTATSSAHAASHGSISLPEPASYEEPQWLLVAEGRAEMPPPPPPKPDLSFPLHPQSPGKGGWPCSRLNLIDENWGGSKDIGKQLTDMSRHASTEHNLARWRQQAIQA